MNEYRTYYDSVRERRNRRKGGNRPLPAEPPFIVCVDNLPDGIAEKDAQVFFKDIPVKNARVIHTNVPNSRDIMYVEFEDVSSLKRALDLNDKVCADDLLLMIDLVERKGIMDIFPGGQTVKTSTDLTD